MIQKTETIIVELEGVEVELEATFYYEPHKPAVLRADPNDCHAAEGGEISLNHLSKLRWLYEQSESFAKKVDNAIFEVLNDE